MMLKKCVKAFPFLFAIAVVSFNGLAAEGEKTADNVKKVGKLHPALPIEKLIPPNEPKRKPIIQHPDEIDADGDRIDDSIVPPGKALGPADNDIVEVEIILSSQLTQAQIQAFVNAGGAITYIYQTVSYGFNGHIARNVVPLLPNLLGNSLVCIKGHTPLVRHLLEATQNGRVRTVWATGFAGSSSGFSGNSNTTIAILDTGTDGSHTDLSGRQAYWKDYTTSAEASAVDYDGHGTHVSSIALGTGAAIGATPTQLKFTQSGTLSGVATNSFYSATLHLPTGSCTFSSVATWSDGGSGKLQYASAADGSVSYAQFGTTGSGTSSLSNSASTSASTSNHYTAVFPSNGTITLYKVANTVTFAGAGDGFNALRGVAPGCKWAGAKVFLDDGTGNTGDIETAIDDLVTNRVTYNIKVANMSLGASGTDTTLRGKVNTMVNNGIVAVVSAGNSGNSTMNDPARAGLAITVGATNRINALTNYSNVGFLNSTNDSTEDNKPDLLAPGGSDYYSHIVAADSNNSDASTKGFTDAVANDYMAIKGTSMAAPFVSGSAALVIDALQQAGLTWDQTSSTDALLVKMLLCATATETNANRENSAGNNPSLDRGGKDIYEGYGILNVDAAIECVSQTVSSSSITNSTNGGQFDRRAWGYKVPLSSGSVVKLTVAPASTLDADVYLYSSTPDSNGNPVILASSVNAGVGVSESISYTSSTSQTAYLVIKRVSGSGSWTMTTSATQFKLSVTVSTVSAGSTKSPTITAQDFAGNTITSYAGSKNLIYSGANSSTNPVTAPTATNSSGTAIQFGSTTAVNFTSGKATVSGSSNGQITFYKAETALISVTDGTLTTVSPLAITVSESSLSKFQWSLSSPQTNASLLTGTHTLTAEDAYGNPITTFDASGDPVTITSSLTGTVTGLGSASNNTLNKSTDFTSGVASLGSFKYTGAAGSCAFTAKSSTLFTGTSSSITINPSSAVKLQILLPGESASPGSTTGKTGSPTAQTAGTAIASGVKINAVDLSWNVVSSSTPNVTVTTNDTYASVADDNGATTGNITLVSGTGTLSSLTFKTAGTSNITATASGLTSITSGNVTVNAGTATMLQVLLTGETSNPGSPTGKTGTPNSQTAGSAFLSGVRINAVDANWNIVSSSANVTITSTDANASIADDNGATAGNLTLSFGIWSLSSFTFKTAGTQTITASATGLTSNTSASVTVNAGAATQLQILLPGETASPGSASGKTGTPSAQTAGAAVASGIKVNAVDANWNIVSTSTPTVTFTATDSNAAIADDNGATAGNITLVSGTQTLSSLTFKTAGTFTITATDTSATLTANTSTNVTVNAGVVTKLQILLPGETASPGSATGKTGTPTAQTAGTAIASGVIVRAVDANWNLVSTSTPNVTITTTDSNASIADDNAGTAGNMTLAAGSKTLSSLTFKTAGTYTVTATDAAGTLTASTSASVAVNAGTAVKLQILLPGETAAPGSASGKTGTPSVQIAGTSVVSAVTINAVDANWNVVTSASPSVSLSSTETQALIADDNGANSGNITLAAGTGTLSSFTFKVSGNWTITASDVSATLTSATSASVGVGAGAAVTLQILLPGESSAPGTVSGKTGTPTAQIAGAAINNGVVVNAVDANWNVVSSAAPNVVLSSTDTNATLVDDNGAAAGNLSLASGTQTLSSLTFRTAGAFTVTATDTSGTLTPQTSASVSVNAGAVAKLQILLPGETSAPGSVNGKTGAPTAQTAGTAITTGIVVNAVDDNWNIVSSATNVIITSTDTNSVIADDNGAATGNISLASGSGSISSVTFATAGSQSLTATDAAGILTANTSAGVTVNAGAVATLQVLLPGETAAPGTASGKTGAPIAQSAGTAITAGIIVNAVDANWNVVDSAGTNVTITSTDLNATISDDNGSNAGNLTLASGTGTLANFTFKTAGTQTISASDSAGFIAGNTSANVIVSAGAVAKLQLLLPGESAAPGTASGKTGTPAVQTAGTAIASGLVINAVDSNWNRVSTVTPDVTITSSDANAVIADDNSAAPGHLTLVAGTGTLSSFTFLSAATQTISAADAAAVLSGDTSPGVTVNPGAVAKLQVLLPGETAAPGTASGKTGTPGAQSAGSAIASGIVVNAVDANWNIVNSAAPNIAITSTDPNASIADDNGGAAGNLTLAAGTGTLSSFTFKTAGIRSLTATDTASLLASAGSAGVTVNPGAASKLQILLPGESAAPGTVSGKTGTPTAQVAGSTIAGAIVINAVDSDWNVITAATTNVTITSTDTHATISDDNGGTAGNLTLTSGTGTLSSFTFAMAGTQTINAADAAGTLTSDTSANVSVTAGAAAKLQILLPGESAAPGTVTGKTGTPTAQTAGAAIVTGIVINAVDTNWNVVVAAPDVIISTTDSHAQISDDNGGSNGNITLASGTGTLSSLTFNTAGSQTITATDAASTLTGSTSAAVNVNAGTAVKLQILLPGEIAAPGTLAGKAGSPTAQSAGSAIASGIQINAVDANWNVVLSATPSIIVTSTDSNAIAADDNGALSGNLTLASGTGTLSSLTFQTAGTQTITATDSSGTLTANVSANVVVNAGAVAKLQVLLPGETAAPGTSSGKTGTPAAQMAGTAIASGIVVNAVDANWNIVSATPNVIISSSDQNAVIADDNGGASGNLTLGSGTAKLSSLTLITAGSQTIVATDASGTLASDTSSAVSVNAGAATQLQILLPGESAAPGTLSGKTGTPLSQTAGISLVNSVLINAVDAHWNVVLGSTPNVIVTSTDSNALIADDNGGSTGNSTLVSGTGTLSSVVFKTAGSYTLIATDAAGTLTTSTSGSVSVGAGAVTKLQVLLPGESAAPGTASGKTGTPTAQVAGALIANGVVVNAVDANWNLVTSATPNVVVTSSDSNASISDDNAGNPGSISLTGGTGTLSSFTFKAAGLQTVTVSDVSGTLTSNNSANVSITAGAVAKLQILLPGEASAPGTLSGKSGTPSGQTSGSAITSGITVNAVDANWNIVNGATPNVIITSTDSNAQIADDNAGANGNLTLASGTATLSSLTFITSGTQSLTATDVSGALAASVSANVTVFAGSAAKLQILLPGESAAPGTPTGKTGAPTAQTAGVSVAGIIVNAVDANWNIVVASVPNITITTTDSNAVIADDNGVTLGNLTLASGAGTLSSVTFKTAGTFAVSAADVSGSLSSCVSANVAVSAGTAAKLQILLPGETPAPGSATGKTGTPTAQSAGTAIANGIVVNAVDANWNLVNSAPNVIISSTDANAAINDDNSGTTGNLTLAAGTGTLSSFTFKTSGAQTISATDAAGTLTASISSSVTVNAGVVTQLQILLPGESAAPGTPGGKTGAPLSQTAGVAIANAIRINAVDANWNVVTAVPNVIVSTTDLNAAISDDNGGASGNVTLTAGIAILSNFTFKTAGAFTITASDAAGILTASTSANVTVNAGSAAKLQVLLTGETAAPGTVSGKSGTPTAQTAGTPISNGIVVNAVDANWNVVVGAAPNVAISVTDSNAVIADDNAASPGNLTLVNGTATLSSLTFKTAGTFTITATDIAGSLTTGTSSNISSTPGVVSQLQILLPGESSAPGTANGKTGTPTVQPAGVLISTVRVNAVDSNWNIVTTAIPNVVISTTDTNALISDDNGVTAGNMTLTAGTATLSGLTFKSAGTFTVTATDAAVVLNTSVSANITVNAGAATKLQILLPGESAAPGTATGKTGVPTAQTAGTAIAAGIRINAVDANWNVVSTTLNVTISSTDANAVITDDNAGTAGQVSLAAGSATLSSLTFKTAGTFTVSAADTSSTLSGNTSANVTINPGVVAKLQVILPGESAAPGSATGKSGTPTSQTAGSAIANGIIVNAVDANWNVVTSAVPKITITASDVNAILSDDNGASTGNMTLSAGTNTLSSLTFLTSGSWAINASDVSSALGSATASVTVKAGLVAKLQVLLPGETAAPGTVGGKSGVPASQTAGNAIDVTINAVDANWNVAGTATPNIIVTATDTNATIPDNNGAVAGNITLTGGTAVLSGVTFKTVGAFTLGVTDTTNLLTGATSASVQVSAGAAAKLQILLPGEAAAPGTASGKTGTAAAQTAGNATSGVIVNAVDANWNLAASAVPNVTITVTDANAAISDDNAGSPGNLTLVAGNGTLSSLTFKTAATQTISAVDASGSLAGGSAVVKVNPGIFSQLQILMPGETSAPGTPTGKTGTATTPVAGATSNFTVVAVDQFFNQIATVSDTIQTTVSGSASTVAPVTLMNGSGIVPVVVSTSGSPSLTFTDIANGFSKTMTVSVVPAASATLSFTTQPPAQVNVSTALSKVQVTVFDQFGNVVSAPVSVTVALNSNSSGATLGGTLTQPTFSGVATFSDLSVDKAGTYTLAGQVSGLTSATSISFSVIGNAPTLSSPITPAQAGVTAGQSVHFTAGSAGTADALTYTWTWGDGTTTTTSTPDADHTFATSGAFNVILTATNSNGQSTSESLNLVVADAGAGGAGGSGGTGGTGGALCDGLNPVSILSGQLSAKYKFPAATAKDSLLLSVNITLKDGFNPAGQIVQWQIAGIAGQTTLDSKGHSPVSTATKVMLRYKKPAKGAAFTARTGTLQISLKGALSASTVLSGLDSVNATNKNKTGDTATATICIVLKNSQAYMASSAQGLYKGKKDKNSSFLSKF